jgi:hypothetical protein
VKKETIEEYIDNDYWNFDFEHDGIGMTWGVSYIRLVVGEKSKFDNIEHFFFSSIKSDKNMTSGIFGGLAWEERTNIKKWTKNLIVPEILNEDLIKFIESSVIGINENLKYWANENSIDISLLDSSKKFEKCLLIKETFSPRHYINTTNTYLTYDRDNYFYIEGHWES